MPFLRLSRTPDVSHGPLDGAWWPRCDVLGRELPTLRSPPTLVGSPGPGVGTVTRVTVDTASCTRCRRRACLRSPRKTLPEKPRGRRKEDTDSGEDPTPVGSR
ncbi:DUF5994 family protein [Streptomyces cinerochromogenes]|uniref:DUF5994 family protein n=1 Tax=Streptomyces cinerochromogenes TaxID=66422 RepID=UPI0033B0EE38